MTTSSTAVPPVRIRPRAHRTIRVALAGCGVVGGELVRLLRASERDVGARFATRFELVRVLVRGSSRPRPAGLRPELLTTDVDAFLATDADVVVEAIGGLDPAARIARAVLASGRRLVTANKVLVAAHGPELVRLAARHRTRVDFESAVAGGIPVLRAIRDQLPLTGIESIRGILNGTTNYILTRMAEGHAYAAALADAQARGFAEVDPARDVTGGDAADKIRILAWLAFGADPAKLAVSTRGIVPHPDRVAADASALGGVPRLLAECVRTAGGVSAAVEPVIVPPDSVLGQLRGEDNIVIVRSRWNGELRLAGPGAGGGPTASALLGDLVRSARPLRGSRHAAALAGAEPEHRWLVSLQARADAEFHLVSALVSAGLSPKRIVRGGGALRTLVERATGAAVREAERRLEDAGLHPVVSRVELPAEPDCFAPPEGVRLHLELPIR
jgi:homoserine dehydrogenase